MFKTIKLIALIAVVATLFACKKDQAEKNSDRLVGTWAVQSILDIEYENNVETGRDEDAGNGETLEFKADGNGIQTDGQYSDSFKWTATDSELKITWDGDEADVFKIKSLSKTDLHISIEDIDVENNITYKEVTEIKLKKK
ncbi:lipocalin-like domain-containing protein [Pedobacter frigoris]|nr:lipocalin family protein [Pedobacter frigoris]